MSSDALKKVNMVQGQQDCPLSACATCMCECCTFLVIVLSWRLLIMSFYFSLE